MAGRYPTPVVQKNLESRSPMPAAKVKVEVPKMPTGMSPQTKKVWRLLVKMLAQQGTIARVDAFALEQICDQWILRAQCKKALEDGLTFAMENGYQQVKPEVALMQKIDRELRQMMVQFGMTPASRLRLQIGQQEEVVDPTKELEMRRLEKRRGMRVVGG